jgi:hypothetical protein
MKEPYNPTASSEPFEDANLPASTPSSSLIPTFTKVDNNLTGIGFFTASSKRSRNAIEKTMSLVEHGKELKISIIPSAKYGLPVTQDQDFWLALMKLAGDHILSEGKLTNPFVFTSAELLQVLGQSDSGQNYKAVDEWLKVMTFTGIEGGVYNARQMTWSVDKTHAVERIVSVGKNSLTAQSPTRTHLVFPVAARQYQCRQPHLRRPCHLYPAPQQHRQESRSAFAGMALRLAARRPFRKAVRRYLPNPRHSHLPFSFANRGAAQPFSQ